MKVTIVPAQITTVEDRIAGPLGLSQLILLVAPIFMGACIYTVLPPELGFALYKLVPIIGLFALGGLLAIRVRGKIILNWLVTILRYALRPRYYRFARRERLTQAEVASRPELAEEPILEVARAKVNLDLSPAEASRARSLLTRPGARLAFITTKKGGLRVQLAKINQER